jgi:hypothetical protein
MADPTPDVLDAANQVIVLAFDLVDATLPDAPELLEKALSSGPVQQAITKTLLDYAKSKGKPGASPATTEEGQKLLAALGTGITDAGSKAVLSQIRTSPEYKKLEAAVTAFKRTAESSPLGVWLDRNRKILYVVGAGLVVSATSALYITKTSGMPVRKVVDLLKEEKFEVLQIGSLRFKAALWDFQPDARVLGARLLATKQWAKVSAEVSLGVLARDADLQQIDGAITVKSGGFSANAKATGKPPTQQVNLGLQFGYSGKAGKGRFDIGLGAMYEDDKLNASLNASLKSGRTAVGLKGTAGPDKNSGNMRVDALLTLSVDL